MLLEMLKQSTHLVSKAISGEVNQSQFSGDSVMMFKGWVECAALPQQESAEQTIQAAYQRWGCDLCQHLKGNFQFAFWDESHKRLVCAQSPAYEGSILYWQQGDRFCFANIMPKLRNLIGQKLPLNEHKIAEMLVLYHRNASETFYKGVKRLSNGHVLIYENNQVKVDAFWSILNIEQAPIYNKRQDYIDDFRERYFRAIEKRLDPSGPTACELSGGLDSSSAAVVAAKLVAKSGLRLKAFGTSPGHLRPYPARKNWNLDDRQLMNDVVNHSGNIDLELIHESRYPFDMSGLAEFCFRYTDGPVRNPLNMGWMVALYRTAGEQGFKHILNGHQGNMTISRAGRDLSLYRRMRGVAGRCKRALFNKPANPQWWEEYSLFTASANAKYQPTPPPFAFGPAKLTGPESLNETLACIDDASGFLQAVKYLSGVELLDPTADQDIMEYCVQLPNHVLHHKGMSRCLIRDAMADLWPDSVRYNTRRGEQNSMWFFQLRDLAPYYQKQLALWRQHDLIVELIDLDEAAASLQQIQVIDPMKHQAKDLLVRYRLKLARALHVAEWIWLHQ